MTVQSSPIVVSKSYFYPEVFPFKTWVPFDKYNWAPSNELHWKKYVFDYNIVGTVSNMQSIQIHDSSFLNQSLAI